ncbi:Dynamin-like protein 2 [Elsinoe fawcettii]|nr:Dynamin-like protein 2 [Elsinoe fawcettii]
MALLDLQLEQHRSLLDIVDRLRLTCATHRVNLPQIVVCGDQSAGKGSVLEAISGLLFPTRDNLWTRFATEVVLRRDAITAVKVSIIPGDDRTIEEQEKLSAFKRDVRISNPERRSLIEETKQA